MWANGGNIVWIGKHESPSEMTNAADEREPVILVGRHVTSNV